MDLPEDGTLSDPRGGDPGLVGRERAERGRAGRDVDHGAGARPVALAARQLEAQAAPLESVNDLDVACVERGQLRPPKGAGEAQQ
jgi:hypothetical protein